MGEHRSSPTIDMASAAKNLPCRVTKPYVFDCSSESLPKYLPIRNELHQARPRRSACSSTLLKPKPAAIPPTRFAAVHPTRVRMRERESTARLAARLRASACAVVRRRPCTHRTPLPVRCDPMLHRPDVVPAHSHGGRAAVQLAQRCSRDTGTALCCAVARASA